MLAGLQLYIQFGDATSFALVYIVITEKPHLSIVLEQLDRDKCVTKSVKP